MMTAYKNDHFKVSSSSKENQNIYTGENNHKHGHKPNGLHKNHDAATWGPSASGKVPVQGQSDH